MPNFRYRYINPKGQKRTGQIEAAHLGEAKEKLRSQNVLFISLEEQRAKKFWTTKKVQIKKEILIAITSQLAQLLKAGIPLYESLLSLEEQYRGEVFHPILLSLCEQIKAGNSLSESLSRFPDTFNRLYCAMVAAGESVGILDTTLEKIAHLLTKQYKLKKQLITALIYPSLLMAFSGVVIFMLLFFVVPSLETLFEDRPVNRFTSLVMQLSYFLNHGFMIYSPILVALLAAAHFFFRSPKMKRKMQKGVLHFPLLKTVIIQSEVARFSRAMGTLLEGGVSIISALQIARKVMKNPFLEEVIAQAEGKIVQGSLLSKELKKSPLIPTLVPRMLSIGEEGGTAAAMLHKIADYYEEEIEKTLGRLTALAQPAILILMGGVVGIIMLAVLLPLTDINAFL